MCYKEKHAVVIIAYLLNFVQHFIIIEKLLSCKKQILQISVWK